MKIDGGAPLETNRRRRCPLAAAARTPYRPAPDASRWRGGGERGMRNIMGPK